MANTREMGRRPRELRRAAGLTQTELGAIIGVTRSTIAGIETGGDSAGLRTAIALADFFKVPLDWMLSRKPPPGGPLAGHFVDDPDELAWLAFWRDMEPDERAAVLAFLGGKRGRRAA